MGKDPERSVLNQFFQAHEEPLRGGWELLCLFGIRESHTGDEAAFGGLSDRRAQEGKPAEEENKQRLITRTCYHSLELSQGLRGILLAA